MKVLRFFKKLVITLSALAVLTLLGGFLFSYSYARFDQSGQALVVSGHNLISDNFYTDITPNSKSVDSLKDFVSSLPSNVSGAFQTEWKVVISTDMPSVLSQAAEQQEDPLPIENADLYSILGYSDWHLRTIFLKAQPDPKAVFRVFAHEMGHYFDYEFGSPSATQEFQEVYLLYKDTFTEADPSATAGYATSTPSEFFATVFKEYFLYPEHLSDAAPAAYEFISIIYTDVSNNEAATTTLKYDLKSALLALEKRFTQEEE